MIIESPNDVVFQEDLEYIAKDTLIPLDLLKNSTILITGATGLVGYQLVKALACCNRLKNCNIHIIAMVRNVEKAKSIYGKLLDRDDVELVTCDITKPIEYHKKIDFIIHGASITTSKIMVMHPVNTIQTALYGTDNLLRFAADNKVRGFVYLSSMEAYGNPDTSLEKVTEVDLGYINPLLVRSNYPESKRMCESLCTAYVSEYNLPVRIARLAQTFGAGILPGENRVFAQFARSAINGTDIVLHTSGKSEGNYCYTRDTIRALLLLLAKGEQGQAYNIVNEDSHISILDMAKMVASKIANGTIKVVFDIPESNEFGYAPDVKMKLDSSKIKMLGWNAEVGLEEAYRRLIMSLDAKIECNEK